MDALLNFAHDLFWLLFYAYGIALFVFVAVGIGIEINRNHGG